jgi:hypothetical protein
MGSEWRAWARKARKASVKGEGGERRWRFRAQCRSLASCESDPFLSLRLSETAIARQHPYRSVRCTPLACSDGRSCKIVLD